LAYTTLDKLRCFFIFNLLKVKFRVLRTIGTVYVTLCSIQLALCTGAMAATGMARSRQHISTELDEELYWRKRQQMTAPLHSMMVSSTSPTPLTGMHVYYHLVTHLVWPHQP